MCETTNEKTTNETGAAFLAAIGNKPAIYPGMCGACADCSQHWEIDKNDYALEIWEERDRLHIGLKFAARIQSIELSGETLVDFWDNEAREFCEQWGASSPDEILAALIEHADDICAEWAPELLSAYYTAKIAIGDFCDDGEFSRYSCDCCGAALAGERFAAHSVDENREITHWEICVDCLQFCANGTMPEKWEG